MTQGWRASRRESQVRMGHDILWMREYLARMKERIEVEHIVVVSGRRPHGCLQSQDALRGAAQNLSARRRSVLAAGWSGGLGLDLARIACTSAGNCDAPGLHGFGDLALKLDDQQPILEAGSLDLHVVGQGELALE